ncbi:MAG TPA: hypothetical protein VFG94_03700, partial [Acidimicrobiales bacterium]|nr:hypothetical protein [Acidimicrobiales bacterium]
MAPEHSDPEGDAGADDDLRAWDDPTPLSLSHHWPDEYDRCVTVGGRKVCRRCLVLYPTALVSAVVLG